MAKTFIGTVVSDKTDKTISVKVVTHKNHPIYKKQYIQSRKFKAHDEKNEAQYGDKVSITEIRPVSREKNFALKKIIERPILTDQNTAKTEEVVKEVVKKAEKKPVKKVETPKGDDK
jgi:small subunit ribosomal protein S17